MSQAAQDNKTFESKVANLIATTRHLEVPQILLLRRLTMADPESRRWASDRQLKVVFSVLITKALERMGVDKVRDVRAQGAGLDSLIMPGKPGDRAEDLQVLSDIVDGLLGPAEIRANPDVAEHESALAKLFSMQSAPSPTRTVREVNQNKEPPPLFAAQLGPESERMMPSGSDKVLGDAMADRPFVDFPTLMDDTLCAYSRKVLEQFQVRDITKPGRMPFGSAPEFIACYEAVLRRFVLPNMRASRHIQQLGISYNWEEVGPAKLIDIIQSGEHNNPLLHNWDNRWNAFRPTKGKKLKAEDNPWPLFREDATKCNYEPPTEENLRFLQDIIRFEVESIGKAWRELCQLYEQEFHPSGRQDQAREGAFRDGLVKWCSKLPENVGEFLAIKAYYTFPNIGGTFMRKLLTNFGRSDADRRKAAMILSDFSQTLTD